MNGDNSSPSNERQMGNHDEAMYEYGGPGVPPFTSDMPPPPPVLMPVPGAGLVSLPNFVIPIHSIFF